MTQVKQCTVIDPPIAELSITDLATLYSGHDAAYAALRGVQGQPRCWLDGNRETGAGKVLGNLMDYHRRAQSEIAEEIRDRPNTNELSEYERLATLISWAFVCGVERPDIAAIVAMSKA